MTATPTSSILAALTAAFLVLVAAPGCSGERTFHEFGEECWDGKDNDSDGAVDCKDPDCASMAICGGNGKQDSGPRDGPVGDSRFIQKDTQKPPTPDKYVAPPADKTVASSFGQRCAYKSGPQLCPDGKTVCILGKKSSSSGYCTYPCNGSNYDSCPAGPSGTIAKCLFNFAGKDYCAFLCKYLGNPYTCPGNLGCYYFTLNQKFCWP